MTSETGPEFEGTPGGRAGSSFASQNERLTRCEDANCDLRGCEVDGRCEANGRFFEKVRTTAPHADWVKGAPMDRDHDLRMEPARRLCRADRIEMPRTKSRSPAPDWHERDVQIETKFRHAVEEICITGKIDALRAAEHVSHGVRCRAERRTPTGVVGGYSADHEISNLFPITNTEFSYPAESPPYEPVSGTARHKHELVVAETAQRWQIEMIPMQVRNQDCINAPRPIRFRQRDAAPEVRDAASKHRIGQDPGVVVLQEHRRVAKPSDRGLHCSASVRRATFKAVRQRVSVTHASVTSHVLAVWITS